MQYIEEKILDFLPRWGYGEKGKSTTEVANYIGIDSQKALAILKKLQNKKFVRCRCSCKGYVWFRTK